MTEHNLYQSGCGWVALVNEDNAIIRAHIADTLRDKGFEVLEEESVEDATRHLMRRSDIDLVVTDIRFAGELTGLDLAHWITQYRPQTRVLAISGNSHAAMGSLQPHRYAFLTKPFSPQVLISHAMGLLSAQPQ